MFGYLFSCSAVALICVDRWMRYMGSTSVFGLRSQCHFRATLLFGMSSAMRSGPGASHHGATAFLDSQMYW